MKNDERIPGAPKPINPAQRESAEQRLTERTHQELVFRTEAQRMESIAWCALQALLIKSRVAVRDALDKRGE